MVKMFCIDLDGTLLTDEKRVSKENKRAIEEAYRAGVEIVIATGRQYRKAKEFAQELEIPVTMIANNGTCIRDITNDRRILLNPMPVDLVEDILRSSRRHRVDPIVHVDQYECGTDIVIPKRLPERTSELYGLQNSDWVKTVDEIDMSDVTNAVSVVYFGNRRELDLWYQTLKEEVDPKHVVHFMENLQKFEAMLELLGETGTKWHGIVKAAETKGIRPEEIAVIGDDSNDLHMIENAGMSFSPSNGIAIIRKRASILLEQSNNEDAVAHAIRRILS